MSKVVIFGTGSFAELAHYYLTHDSAHDVVAFTVHRSRIDREMFHGAPVVPYESIGTSHPPAQFDMFIAVGYANVNKTRAAIYNDAKAKGYRLISYVSPRCTRMGEIPVGDNCFIFEDNTLQPFAVIGNDVIMWSGNHIGHHARIGDHCFITSHVVVSGYCEVGAYSFLGINASLRDSIRIGSSCVIGAGCLIMKSTKDREVYVGQRTKPFSKASDQIRI